MDIPIDAEVSCANGLCGRSTNIILNPTTEQVTHVVVRESGLPFIERLVPVEYIVESTPHRIRLRCTKEELSGMDTFIESEYIASDLYPYPGEPYMLYPYVSPDADVIPVMHERIPPGELAITRGTHVKATDGQVGRVDELLMDPESGHITHLLLREGHLWGQKDITIPVSQIDRIEKDAVYLKLDKRAIEALPEILRALTDPEKVSSPRLREGVYHALHYSRSRVSPMYVEKLLQAPKGPAADIAAMREVG